MPITAMTTDPEILTLTVIADFTVPVRRLWDAYLDPRRLERFWGPTEYPATFLRHDARPGGLSRYYMTGPDGERYHGYWRWVAVDAPVSFEVRDGFAHDDGTPNEDLPEGRMVLEFAETALGSRVTITSTFGSTEEMEQILAMGQVEGMRDAMGQMDEVLEDLVSFAAGRGTELQLLGERQARVSRVIRGSVEQVWSAHTEPEVLQRWQLGPEGWSMPVCEYGAEPGRRLRTEWQNDENGERFGFVGEVVEAQAPHRLVTTERMVSPQDPDVSGSPETLNEMTLTPVEGGTLLSYLITYPDAETREAVIATGMVEGMEGSYQRLEREVLAA